MQDQACEGILQTLAAMTRGTYREYLGSWNGGFHHHALSSEPSPRSVLDFFHGPQDADAQRALKNSTAPPAATQSDLAMFQEEEDLLRELAMEWTTRQLNQVGVRLVCLHTEVHHAAANGGTLYRWRPRATDLELCLPQILGGLRSYLATSLWARCSGRRASLFVCVTRLLSYLPKNSWFGS